jgi:hypothetical protein
VRPRVRATQIQTTLARAVYHWSAGARSAVMNGRKLDSQQVELVGTALLRTHLLADGVELAEPVRDRGVDLIAYLDAGFFRAVPLQVKASTNARFGVDRKYERFPELRLVHLWNVQDPANARIFCTTYAEAVGVADELGWTATESWNAKGYSSAVSQASKGGQRIIDALAAYEVHSGSWHERLFGLARTTWLPIENPADAANTFVLVDQPARYRFTKDGQVFHSGESGRVLINLDERILWLRQDTTNGEPVTAGPDGDALLVFRPHDYVTLDMQPGRLTATRSDPAELLTLTWRQRRRRPGT